MGSLALQNPKCFIDLGLQLLLRLQEHQQLAAVHLEHHACDFASKLGLIRSNHGVQLLTKHLLLHTRWCCGQGGSIECLSCTRHLLRRCCWLWWAHLCLRHPSLLWCHGTLHLLRRHHRAHHAHVWWHAHHRHAAWSTLAWHHAWHASHHWHAGGSAFSWHHAWHATLRHHHLLWVHHRSLGHLRHTHHRAFRTHHSSHRTHHTSHRTHHRPVHAHHPSHLRVPHATSVHLRWHSATTATHHALASLATALATAHAWLVALTQAFLTGFTLLCQADIKRLAFHHLQVHLGHSLGGLVRG
mmetsp:Transcript_124334/g.218904  ORF Transcript_124334/g.218904 Transcript_124334/m.218904 type:complete len:299 (-) Transcript_124334:701-1597(-)